MKNIFVLTITLFFFSCGEEAAVDSEVHSPAIEERELVDSLPEPELDDFPPNLKKLLENPLDLAAFKAEYGPSNSGGANRNAIFDLPDTNGFLYQYMLFHKLGEVLESRPSEGDLFYKFRILVFKYGESVGQFSATNETLMAIECGIDNTVLGDLNVYGMTPEEVMEKFGEPQFTAPNQAIYSYQNKVLSIHYSQTANWYKYARLNESVDLAVEIPSYLLEF